VILTFIVAIYKGIINKIMSCSKSTCMAMVAIFDWWIHINNIIWKRTIKRTLLPGLARFAFGSSVSDNMTIDNYEW